MTDVLFGHDAQVAEPRDLGSRQQVDEQRRHYDNRRDEPRGDIEFQGQNARLPRSLDELVNRPGDCPNWPEGGYLKNNKVTKDPWGHEYIYKFEGAGGDFEIICLGADGQEGGSGVSRDISSKNMAETGP